MCLRLCSRQVLGEMWDFLAPTVPSGHGVRQGTWVPQDCQGSVGHPALLVLKGSVWTEAKETGDPLVEMDLQVRGELIA